MLKSGLQLVWVWGLLGGPCAGAVTVLDKGEAGGAFVAAAPQKRAGSGAGRRRARARAVSRAKAACAAPHEEKMSREKFDALLAKARSAGSVAVVVRLCVAFRPEGELAGEEEARRQRASIARAQDSLLKELSGHRFGSVKRFEYAPFISMVVDAGALRRLKSSGFVSDIAEDASVPPAYE